MKTALCKLQTTSAESLPVVNNNIFSYLDFILQWQTSAVEQSRFAAV
jgi:hypothetical protein